MILKTANTNMTFFGCLGSKIPQSFGTQIHLYPIMQVLVMTDMDQTSCISMDLNQYIGFYHELTAISIDIKLNVNPCLTF